MRKYLAFLLIHCGVTATILGQETGAVNPEPGSYGQVSVNYLSNSVWLGRKDSALTPYLTPALGYYHKSGFFVNGSLSYLTGNSSRIDLYTLEAGFEKDITEKINLGAYADKYFYNSSSTNVQAEMKAMMGVYGSYDLGPVALGASLAYSIAGNNDVITGATLHHDFYAAGEKLKITPMLAANAATQNFYKSFYENRRVRPRTGPGGVVLQQPVVTLDNATKFRVLDYELSAECTWSSGKWELKFLPAYILAVSPAVITIGNKTFTEKLDNSFTVELELSWKF